MSDELDLGGMDEDTLQGMAIAQYSMKGIGIRPTDVGKEYLFREQMRSTDVELRLLQMQIRRTDVELRHLTGDKTLKQFETDMLRIMTLMKSIMMAMIAVETVKAFVTGGATTPELAMSIGMLGMVGATSAGVISELS